MEQPIFFPTKYEFEQAIKKAVAQTVTEKLPDAIEKATRKKWYTTDEAMELLNVSRRQIQYYRDNKMIPFSQHGRTIRYHIDDIEAFLESNRVTAEGSE